LQKARIDNQIRILEINNGFLFKGIYMSDDDIIDIIDKSDLNTPTLDLSDLDGTAIPSRIKKLTKLKILNLSDNLFSVFPLEILELGYLEELNMNGNDLSALPMDISKLQSLKKLVLSENLFIDFPVEVLRLRCLENLDLSRNNISNLKKNLFSDESIGLGLSNQKESHLIKLNLSENNLSGVPEDISKLENLTDLDLHRNDFDKFPIEISKLHHLQRLDLSENNISNINDEISDLESLQELDLSGNGFTDLPPEISKLTRLTKLYLCGNSLSGLPNSFHRLSSCLEELHLNGNVFESFPAQIYQLKKLKCLDISENLLDGFAVSSDFIKHQQLTFISDKQNKDDEIEKKWKERKEMKIGLDPRIIEIISHKIEVIYNSRMTILQAERYKKIIEKDNLMKERYNLDVKNREIASIEKRIADLDKLYKDTNMKLINPRKSELDDIEKCWDYE
jgi:Leucine-rich repeat (LRR) protein